LNGPRQLRVRFPAFDRHERGDRIGPPSPPYANLYPVPTHERGNVRVEFSLKRL
jgi:hypothetical protein